MQCSHQHVTVTYNSRPATAAYLRRASLPPYITFILVLTLYHSSDGFLRALWRNAHLFFGFATSINVADILMLDFVAQWPRALGSTTMATKRDEYEKLSHPVQEIVHLRSTCNLTPRFCALKQICERSLNPRCCILVGEQVLFSLVGEQVCSRSQTNKIMKWSMLYFDKQSL